MEELLLQPEILNRHFDQCSGGEQKRIAIGQELMNISKPDFLVLDEPTTGLDSTAAHKVVQCLKKLAQKYQITVIASIHAPNHETLSLFDKIYVLAKGGVAIYSGPPTGILDCLKLEINLVEIQNQPPVEAIIKIACNRKY